MASIPTNIQTALISGGVRITWDETFTNAQQIQLWVSINSAAYVLLATINCGIKTYDHVIAGVTTKYKLRSVLIDHYSNFNSIPVSAPAPLIFTLTSNGDGSGVSELRFEVSENTTATLSGTAKFYTDAAGTLSESSTWLITSGALRLIYVKVPSGTATLKVKNVITKWGADYGEAILSGWENPAPSGAFNYPNIDIDVSTMTKTTSLNIFGCNTVHGDISGLTQLTYIEIANGYTAGSYENPNIQPGEGCTITGNVALLTHLTVIDVWEKIHLTGDISGLTSLTVIWMATNNFSVFTGSINALINMTYMVVNAGSVLTGSLAGLIHLTRVILNNPISITIPNVTNIINLIYLYATLTLTSTNINQILANLVANGKTNGLLTLYNGTPTGQGVTDVGTLQTRGWTVTTG
jgi:hypothetical protein